MPPPPLPPPGARSYSLWEAGARVGLGDGPQGTARKLCARPPRRQWAGRAQWKGEGGGGVPRVGGKGAVEWKGGAEAERLGRCSGPLLKRGRILRVGGGSDSAGVSLGLAFPPLGPDSGFTAPAA